MKVEIYVEGTSDKYAMEALLAPLIERKLLAGTSIDFIAIKGNDNSRGGDAKKDLLTKTPIKAVNILRNQPDSIVVIIPDLYPKNKEFKHETIQELENGILNNFNQVLNDKGINNNRVRKRFKVFCFKHDLEALILAAESELIRVLVVCQELIDGFIRYHFPSSFFLRVLRAFVVRFSSVKIYLTGY